MELHIKNLLDSGANIEDIYPIYKALKESNLINENKIVRDSSDRDMFFYLIDNIRQYQYSEEYIPFVKDYLKNKDNSVFAKNKPGYYPLEKISSNFKDLKENVLISLFSIIMDKMTLNEFIKLIPNEYGYHDEISEEEQLKYRSRKIVSAAYSSGKFELLNLLKNKGFNITDDKIIRTCADSEENLKYFIKNHPDLNKIISYDGEEASIWKILINRVPISYLPIIEDWCAKNIDNDVLESEKINKLKSSLQISHSKTCEKLKSIDGWETLKDENNLSMIRYAINIDPSHANKLTLKKSLNALNEKDNKGENVWLELLANIDKIHLDAVIFIKDNVELTLNNKKESIFEQLLNNIDNKNYPLPNTHHYSFKENIKKRMTIIGKRDPNIILGSKDFLESITNNKDIEYYKEVLPKMIYHFMHNLKSSKIEEIENKEWLGFYIILSLIENQKAGMYETINDLLTKGAVLPKSMNPEVINEIFDKDETLKNILINLKQNKSLAEKNILMSELTDERFSNSSMKKRI